MTVEWASFIDVLGEREDSIGVINLCHAIGESPVISADAGEYNDPDGKTKYYKFYHSGIEMGFRKDCLSHIHFYFGNEDEYSPFTGIFGGSIGKVATEQLRGRQWEGLLAKS